MAKMKFKTGQRVRIKEKGKAWFGKYVGTEAEIMDIIADVVEVKTYDNKKYYSAMHYLEPLLPNIPETELLCSHKGAYLNNPVNQFKFMYCPDCGEDWDV